MLDHAYLVRRKLDRELGDDRCSRAHRPQQLAFSWGLEMKARAA